MDLDLIENLLVSIDRIVQVNEPYKAKAEAIKAACSDKDNANLEEFLAWFDEVDE